jgi:hypothetical protein
VYVNPAPLWDVPPVCEPGSSELTECSFFYPPDTVVNLVAESEPDSKFMGWGAACTGAEPCDISLGVMSPWDVQATFLGPRELTLMVLGSYGGRGQVDLSPPAVGGETTCAVPEGTGGAVCRLVYPPEVTVSLTAVPVSGSAFLGWGGGCAGTEGCTIVTIEPVSVWARFEVPNIPPVVSLDSPVPGTVLTAPATIDLAATAGDVDGGIVQVEFFQGETSLGVDSEPPYTMTWSDVPAGAYVLTARATDVRGGVIASTPVLVTVESRVEAIADTYIQTVSLIFRRAHGSDTTLRVRNRGSWFSYWTYLKFDTSGIPEGSAVRIRLRGGQRPLTAAVLRTSVYPVYDTSWDERLLAWDNRPDSGETELDTVTLNNTETEAWYEWDVTGYVLQEKAAGRDVVSFVLKNGESSREYGWFWSREALTNRPELVITP